MCNIFFHKKKIKKFDKLRNWTIFRRRIIELTIVFMKHEKSHRFRDDLFTWWSIIREYRANNLAEFKEMRTRIELEYLSMIQDKKNKTI